MNSIEVVASGPLSTVQDAGRVGYQHLGFAASGAADLRALYLANHLVGNAPTAAGIEVTLGGLVLRPEADVVFAVVGAGGSLQVGGAAAPLNRTLRARRGEEIRLTRLVGARGYLAIAGGVRVPRVLGSSATDLVAGIGGLGGRKLAAGDALRFGPSATTVAEREVREEFVPSAPRELVADMSPGPQAQMFDEEAFAVLAEGAFTISPQSDRVGLRLEGPRIRPSRTQILSEGQPAGAVQIPPGGEPIVLLAGRLTVGGYPKIAVVSRRGIAELAQLLPGSAVRLRLRPLEQLVRETRAWLRCLADPDGCTRAVLGVGRG